MKGPGTHGHLLICSKDIILGIILGLAVESGWVWSWEGGRPRCRVSGSSPMHLSEHLTFGPINQD